MTVCSLTSHWKFYSYFFSNFFLISTWCHGSLHTCSYDTLWSQCRSDLPLTWDSQSILSSLRNEPGSGWGSWSKRPMLSSPRPCAMMSWVAPTPPWDRASRIKLGSPHSKVDRCLGHTSKVVLCPRLARPICWHRLWAHGFAWYRARCPGEEYLQQSIQMVLEPSYFKTLTITSHLWGSKIFS